MSNYLENLLVNISPYKKHNYICSRIKVTSKQLKEQFIKKFDIDKNKLFDGRNLSLEECINNDLIKIGILEENIHSLGLCTNCEKEIKLHSYRKSNGAYGRLFSFVYIKE